MSTSKIALAPAGPKPSEPAPAADGAPARPSLPAGCLTAELERLRPLADSRFVIDGRDRVLRITNRPTFRPLYPPASVIGRALPGVFPAAMDNGYRPACEMARDLRGGVPFSYRFWHDGRWVVRTALASPRPSGLIELYVWGRTAAR